MLTSLDADMIDRADDEHLAVATHEARVLCSFNVRDFARIHGEWLAEGKSHPGIVLARQQQYRVGDLMRRLLKLAATLDEEQMVNRMEFLSNWG